jgi:carbon monoxide dehydrogenase subunit G
VERRGDHDLLDGEVGTMAKFPTTVEKSITVRAHIEKVYAYLWDAPASSVCIAGIDYCEKVGDDTYCFVFETKSVGPVSMNVQYTARYEGNGSDTITFKTFGAEGDNTDVEGTARLKASGDATKIVLKQMTAPDTPVPRLLQGMLRSFVDSEAEQTIKQFLANIKRELESV